MNLVQFLTSRLHNVKAVGRIAESYLVSPRWKFIIRREFKLIRNVFILNTYSVEAHFLVEQERLLGKVSMIG